MNPYQPTDPNEDEQQAAAEDRLQIFGASLAKLRDEWITARRSSGWDRRVNRAIDQYNNVDAATKQGESMMDAVERGYPANPQAAQKVTRSTVFIGLTRQKTNAADARLSDIILPTDDRNFGIQPTPNPSLAKELDSEEPALDPASGQPMFTPEGQPIQRKQIAAQIQKVAASKAEAMQREIDDQLNECDYKGELRKVIHDAAVKGTGVIKGPIVINRTKRTWGQLPDSTGGIVHVLQMIEETKPASVRVDPRNVWEDPACGDDVQNGRGIFERDLKTTKQVRALAKQNGYMVEQIRKVLDEGPKPSAAWQGNSDKDREDPLRTNFEVWEYWGEVDPEDAKAAGLTVTDDVLDAVDVCVVMINDTVVKVFESPLETGELPYDFFPWEKVSDSPRGKGVPEIMESQQRVLNAAWRTMMDNMGTSSGPQIVMRQQGIKPADGSWNIQGNKIWWATDATVDVRTAFATFNVDTRQAELSAIVDMATKLADEETGVPLIMQGNERNAPETMGAMQMLMNASNVVLRRLVKQFDDKITRPHIRRYYDFNMLYSDKSDIKGDFDVDARGSSALLVRDIQNQAFMNLLAAASNPTYSYMIDPKKIFEKALQAQHVDPREIMLPDEQIEQNRKNMQQQQPQDSSMQVAQIRSQTELQKVQINQQSDMAELQFKAQEAERQRQHEAAMANMQLQIKMMELAQTKELSLEQIKATLADTALKERSRKELYNAEANLKLATGQGI